MSGTELAKTLGVSRATLYRLRNTYRGAPMTFDDIEGWRRFVGRFAIAVGTRG
jgi:predicted DNA-binding transcriptional regulator YafY